MKTVVIISEYNPFHSGHEYMISELRLRLGDIAVAAIMSDPFTERGEPAVFPAEVRAEAAVRGGADLVLSLPMPYCASGGSYFAAAGTRAAAELFPGAMLAFGSESGDLGELEEAARNLQSPGFEAKISDVMTGDGIAAARESVYSELYGGEAAKVLKSPNNMLGIEYITAIQRENLCLTPYTLRRIGGEYSSLDSEALYPSASALRAMTDRGDREGFLSKVPAPVREIYRSAFECGNYSKGFDKIGSAVLSHFRLNPCGESAAEMSGGLAGRLSAAAGEARDITEFFDLAASKCYTNAKIRRGVLSAMLGITPDDLSAEPEFLRLLAFNSRGRELLKSRRIGKTEVVTRPSEYKNSHRQCEIYRRASALYDLTLEKPRGAAAFMTESPVFIEN